MESFPFRPPQFSDDVAWLPAWLQSNQAATPLNQLCEDPSYRSLQNLDALKGDNSRVKDLNLQPSIESRYNICHLYLSGDGNTPVTLTPPGEKVLHFNLHLSTDGISSNISSSLIPISQDDKLNSAIKSRPVHSGKALDGSQGTSLNMEHVSSPVNLFPSPSNETVHGIAGMIHSKKQRNWTDAKKEIIDEFNSKGMEYDDINDAIELSVSASEALVIYELVQGGPISEALSAAAILEASLRVKQARLEGVNDSLCCSKGDGSTADCLSDLSDSDMESSFNDVGLSVNNLINILVPESSVSRVKDTPLSEFVPYEDREGQGEQQIYQEMQSNSFVAKCPEKSLDIDKSKDLRTECNDDQEVLGVISTLDPIFGSPYGSENGNLDDLQLTQGDKHEMVNTDQFPHQLDVKSSSLSGKASEECTPMRQHSHSVDIDKVSYKSTCGFQSRWFGGWVEKEGDACGIESKSRKITCNHFIAETSYLSESADVVPDQHSFVHNDHHSSRASESSIPLESSCGTAGAGGSTDQGIVKDSCLDPLCSIVPCSLATRTDDSPQTNKDKDKGKVLDSVSSLLSHSDNLEIAMKNVQISSGHNGESVGRKKQDKPLDDVIGPSTLICRQLSSLRPYSVGAIDSGLASAGQYSTRLPSSDDEDRETKLLFTGEHRSCTKTTDENVHRKEKPFKSLLRCSLAISNENHETSGFGNVSGSCAHDISEQNAGNEAELPTQQPDKPASPLVLSNRKRHRLKAPKLPITNFSTNDQVEDQGPGIPQDIGKELPDSEIPARKRVRFSDPLIKLQPTKNRKKELPARKTRSSCRGRSVPGLFDQEGCTTSQEVKERLTKFPLKGRKRPVFQGLEFLLTGFSKKKEKEIETLLRKHGGMVLSDIPSPPPPPRGRRSLSVDAQKLPVILCTKKLQTTKFLYGCAVNAFLLKVAWAYHSIKAGSVLLPDTYVISSNQTSRNLPQVGKFVCQIDNEYIFDKVGIMLHGRSSFCSKLVKVVKHGRGHVYRSLHWLVQSLESKKISIGVVVTEDENRATRHLKKCAAEQNIPVVPASWITRSLFEGKLLPFDENHQCPHFPAAKISTPSAQQECSQEI